MTTTGALVTSTTELRSQTPRRLSIIEALM